MNDDQRSDMYKNDPYMFNGPKKDTWKGKRISFELLLTAILSPVLAPIIWAVVDLVKIVVSPIKRMIIKITLLSLQHNGEMLRNYIQTRGGRHKKE